MTITDAEMFAAVGKTIELQYYRGGSRIFTGRVRRVEGRTFLWVPLSGWWVTFHDGFRACVYPHDSFSLKSV